MLTTEQREQRKGKITSSVAAAALGLHSYKTPLQAWMDVRGEAPNVGTKATERGDRLERIVLEYPAEVLGLKYRPAPFRIPRGQYLTIGHSIPIDHARAVPVDGTTGAECDHGQRQDSGDRNTGGVFFARFHS